MKIQNENILKRSIKRKISYTIGLLVTFMITGNIGFGAAYNKDYAALGEKADSSKGEEINKTIDSLDYNVDTTDWGTVNHALTSAYGGVYDINSNTLTINHSKEIAGRQVVGLALVDRGIMNINSTKTEINVSSDTGIAIGMSLYNGKSTGGEKLNIKGNELIVTVNGKDEEAFGISTGTIDRKALDTTVEISTDKTKINVKSEKTSHGIAAQKGGSVKINSGVSTEIDAKTAIYLSGNSYVGINDKDLVESTTIINGDIRVTDKIYDESGKYDEITNDKLVVVNFNGENSKFNGNVYDELSENSKGKNIIKLSFKDGATWKVDGLTSLSGEVNLKGGNLNLDNGSIRIYANQDTLDKNGIFMQGENSAIRGTGNINSNIAISNTGNIFNLGEGSTLTGKVTLVDKANAQNQGYLALGTDSSISVGQGATFTNEEGATIKGTTDNQKVIEVNGGTAINNGTIDLTGTIGSYAMYATANSSTLTNNGTIKVDYKDGKGSKVFGEADGITSVKENTNTGKIQVNGYNGGTSSAAKDTLDELLLGSKATNTGMYVDENGKAIMFGNVITGEMYVNDALEKIETESLQIGEEGATIKADGTNITGKEGYLSSINIAGDLKLASSDKSNSINIENVTTNIDSTSTITIGSGLTANFVNGTINGEVSNPAISIEKDGILGLNNMTVNGNIESDYASFEQPGTYGESTLSMNGINTINGHIDVSNIDINSGETTFSSNSSFGGKMDNYMTSKDGIAIFEVAENGDNALLNTSENGNSVTIDGKFKITPDNLTKDEEIKLGENNDLTNAEFLSSTDKSKDVYLTELDKTDNTIYAKYNKELLSEYGDKLNNINNAFQVINDKISQDKLERADLANKVYAGIIYAETVRMAYDNNKLVENELLKINPEVTTGEWAVNGKALYMKNEYTREGVIADYKSEKESTGLLASAEYGLNDTTNLGFAFAGINHSLDTDTGKADGDAFYLGAFAKKELGNYRLTAGLGYEFNRFDADENIFGGSEKYDANVYSAYIEGRYSKDLGDNLTFEPKLKLGYTYVDQDAIQDGTYKLDSQDISIFDTEIGADFIKTVPLKDGRLDVVFGASYAMAFGDTDDEFEGRFIGTGGLSSTFNMVGANVAERNVNLGLGLGVTKDSGLFYNGGVTFKAGSDNYRDYGVTLGAGYKF